MKKLFCLTIGLAFTFGALFGAWAQAYDIDVSKLPSDAAYRRHIDEFTPLYKYVAAWTPDWGAGIPKSKVVSMLKSLLAETNAFIAKDKSGNVDLRLFQVFLKSCLYNTDLPEYHDEIVKELLAIKKQYPKDYRAYWMLANHYGSADMTFTAVSEYTDMFKTVSDNKPIPSVMDDYMKVCFYTMMFSRCKLLMEEIAKENKKSDPGEFFPLYAAVNSQLKEPPPKHAFPNDLVYQPQRREFEAGYLNRALGIWLPLKDTWKVSAFELTAEAFSTLLIVLPQKNSAGKDISSDLSIIFQARPQETFEAWVDKALAKLDKKQLTRELKTRWPATVYEITDPSSDRTSGGSHGYVVFVKRSQPKIKGLAIEAPAVIPFEQNSRKVNMVILNEGYTRFDGDIYYAFTFKTPEENFSTVKKEFFGFMDRVLLD
ncbi:MAG: hypothetical protein JXD23_00390 [Spirochaetales bacterium]|nr:hypothetical protein [Spirochaetales bacterium]